MIIGGNNKYFSLGKELSKEINYEPCVSPPLNSTLNITSLQSYSVFDNHAKIFSQFIFLTTKTESAN